MKKTKEVFWLWLFFVRFMMRRDILIPLCLFLVVPLFLWGVRFACSQNLAEVNLASGKPSYFLPRQAESVTMSLTDGKKAFDKDSLDFSHTYPAPFFYLDLGDIYPVKTVRVYCSRGRDSALATALIAPTLTLFAGETWDKMFRVGRHDPRANLEINWEAGPVEPISFENLGLRSRYIVVIADNTYLLRGTQFSEIEVLKGDFPDSAAIVPKETLSLEKVWTDFASISNVQPFDPSYVTPHIPWAKPLRGKPVTTLFITGRGVEREIVEILQRIPMRYGLLRMEDTSAGNPDKGPVLNFILEKSFLKELEKPVELILISSNVYWQDLTEAVRNKILEKVKQGAGLLYINPYEPRLDPELKKIISGLDIVPYDSFLSPIETILDKPVPVDLIRQGTYGKGRVAVLMLGEGLLGQYFRSGWVLLGYTPAMRDLGDLPNKSDLYYSLFVKVIRWTADRTEKQSLIKIKVTNMEENRFDLEVKAANHSPNEFNGLVVTELRNPEFKFIHQHSLPISLGPGGEETFSFSLTPETTIRVNGEYIASVFLRDQNGYTIDWGNAFADRQGAGIKVLRLEREYFELGSNVTGQLRTTYQNVEADAVHFRLVDTSERLCDEQTINLENSLAEFNLATSRVKGLVAFVEAHLIKGEKEIDFKKVSVPLGINQPLKLSQLSWYRWSFGHPGIPWNNELIKLEKRAGVDGGFFDPKMGLRGYYLPLYSLDGGGYGTSGPTPDDLTKPETWRRLEEKIRKEITAHAPWGVTDFSIGDETRLDDPQSKIVQKAFQDAMQKKYGTIEALNQAWGTNYKSFEEIPTPEFTDAYLGAGFNASSLNPWFAYRKFLDDLFLDPLFKGVRLVSDLAPGRRLGLEGIGNLATTNTRWYDLMQNVKHLIYYDSNPLAARTLRSFLSKDQYVAAWSGYDVGDRDELWAYWEGWKELCRGFNGVATFGGLGGFRSSSAEGYRPYHPWGIYNTDLTFRRTGKIFSDQVLEIKRGIGSLIINAEPAYDVAVHYAGESSLASVGVPGPWRPWGQCWWWHAQVGYEWNAVCYLLDDLGLNWRLLAPPQLEAGELTPEKYKLFVLAMSVALSDQEVAAITRYVQEGGTLLVLADHGLFDREGRFRTQNPLESLTGVSFHKTLSKNGPYSRASVTGLELPTAWISDPELEVKEGAVVVKTFDRIKNPNLTSQVIPAIVQKDLGKGRTIFFNGYLFEYIWGLPHHIPGPRLDKNTPAEKTSRGYRQLMRELIKSASVSPHLTAQDIGYSEPQLPYAEWMDFVDGNAHYYSVLERHFRINYYDVYQSANDQQNWRPVTFGFPEKAHIYDIREKKYLGFTDRITVSLGTCIAKIFAAMPYRVDGLEATGNKIVKQGEALEIELNVKTAGASPVTHAVNLEFFNPAGIRVDAYSGPVLLKQGSGKASITTALNDQTGTWKVIATEIVSGVTKELKFNVVTGGKLR